MEKSVFTAPEPVKLIPEGGASTAVILVHGFGGTPAEVKFTAYYLFKESIAVYCPLLDGHGTKVSDLSSISYNDWLKSVEEFIEVASRNHGNLYIGGLSMGALIAIHHYVKKSNFFKGLIVLSVPLKLCLPNEIVLKFLSILTPPFEMLIPKFAGPDVKDPEVRKILPTYDKYSLKSVLNFHQLRQVVIRSDIPLVEGRVLLLHGAKDIVTPPVNMEIFRGMLNNNRCLVDSVTFKNSGHLITVDYDREVVAETILKFITRNIEATSM